MTPTEIYLALRDAGCRESVATGVDGTVTIGRPEQGVRMWLRDGRVYWRRAPASEKSWTRGDEATVAEAWAALRDPKTDPRPGDTLTLGDTVYTVVRREGDALVVSMAVRVHVPVSDWATVPGAADYARGAL